MDENEDDVILITTELGGEARSGRTERGLGDAIAGAALKGVPVQVLQANMKRFFDQLRSILATGSETIGDFELSRVEVSAQITGDGRVSLLGSGMKVGVEGGVKFVLTRGEG